MKQKIALSGLITLAFTAQAATVSYDPSLGTFPDDQGFTRIENDGHTAASVSDGLLHQFLDTGVRSQYWYDSTLPVNFLNGTFTLEANLKVITSEYSPTIADGNQRSGYYLGSIDNEGRTFYIGISSGGITINTDGAFSPTQGVPFKSFDTTTGFHDYRFQVAGGIGSLYIDDALFASLPVGAVIPPLVGVPYRDLFGDASGLEGSTVDLKSFSASTGVPDSAPTSVLLIGSLVAGAFLRRRV